MAAGALGEPQGNWIPANLGSQFIISENSFSLVRSVQEWKGHRRRNTHPLPMARYHPFVLRYDVALIKRKLSCLTCPLSPVDSSGRAYLVRVRLTGAGATGRVAVPRLCVLSAGVPGLEQQGHSIRA